MGCHSRHSHLLFMLVLISLSPKCQSWFWFSSSSDQTPPNKNPSKSKYISSGYLAEFSLDGLNNHKGLKLVENAKIKMLGSNTCFQNAYGSLFAGCSKVLAEEETRSRLAWHLSSCFQEESGRSPFPSCDSKSTMLNCRKALDAEEHIIYLKFYLETNSICHQLQTIAFKHETERLVNELKKSAQFAEDKLETIEDRSEYLLQSSNQIQDNLSTIDLRTQLVAQASKEVGDHINVVLKHSKAVYEQAKGIAASQSELREGQTKMKEKLEEGMAMLHDSYNNLGQEIDILRSEATEIEKEITKVGDTMFLKMNNLQSKADDIGDIAGSSLDKQKELLDGQSMALEGLQFLTKFQSHALEESRTSLKNLAEFSTRQQDELLQRQEQLQQAHDHLVKSSKTILEAQETFESKQTTMLVALDKLFNLHKAMLLESRLIKAFFIYSLSIFVLYMFTSTKQTYPVRPRLYTGLCATFMCESAVLRFTTNELEQQTWLISLIRLLFLLLASGQLLYTIFTYRDYEVLNHQMLLTLMDMVNGMQNSKDSSCDVDSDDLSWCSWIESELPEEVNSLEDPHYMLREEVGENSITTGSLTRKYNVGENLITTGSLSRKYNIGENLITPGSLTKKYNLRRR